MILGNSQANCLDVIIIIWRIAGMVTKPCYTPMTQANFNRRLFDLDLIALLHISYTVLGNICGDVWKIT